MTQLIDLSFIKNKQQTKKEKRQDQQHYDFQKISMNLINRTLQKIIQQIDKNFIKIHQMYFFHLDYPKMKGDQFYWNNRFTLYGLISIKLKLFTLKLYLLDSNGLKICPKSTHHRTLLSNFVLQINAQLQNFKLQYNPESGELSFVFNINCQYFDETSVTDLIEYALQCYFEQSEAHFYILSLMEIINFPQNQFLQNIEEDTYFLKKFLRERKIENSFIKKQLNSVIKNQEIVQQGQYYQLKQITLSIKDIQNYLLLESKSLQVEKETNPNTLKQVYRKFKSYYKEQHIFSRNLANKTKYKNHIQIQAKTTSNIASFFQTKVSFNADNTQKMYRYQLKLNLQNEESYKNIDSKMKIKPKQTEQIQQQTQKLRIWDKSSGKNYLIQLVTMRNDQAKKQQIILQKLCKLQSFIFFNQYISIENFNLSQMGYIAVNANPNRVLLSQFLKNNDHTLSVIVRFTLCINLLEIFYTLIMKSKITNYFPQVSITNLQITKNLYLSFKYLSKISAHPLFELINTINQIIFQKPINSIKQIKLKNSQIVKADEALNKFFGVSTQITLIKYYLLEFYHESIYLMKVQDLKGNKTNRSQESQRIDYQIKQIMLRTCQQLLVLFNHFKDSLSRGYEEQLGFTEEFSEED